MSVYYIIIDGAYHGSYYSAAAVEKVREMNQGSKIEVMKKKY